MKHTQRTSRHGRIGLICSSCLLSAVLAACSQPGTPGLSIALDEGAVAVAPGGSITVMVEVTREGGFVGEVDLAVIGLPPGLSYELLGDTVDELAGLVVRATSAVPVGSSASVTVRATGVGLANAPATATLTIETVPAEGLPPPDVSIATRGYGTSRQVRQGAGVVHLRLTGGHVEEATAVAIEGLSPFGDDVASDILERNEGTIVVRFTVPHGAPTGVKAVVVESGNGTTIIDEALEVTPIVFSQSGSDTGTGTFDLPFRSLELETIAGPGDEVQLLEGEYLLETGISVPSDVHVKGIGTVTLRAAGPQVPGLQLDGDARVSDLALNGFSVAITVFSGEVVLRRVRIIDSAGTGLGVVALTPSAPPVVYMEDSRIERSGSEGLAIFGPTHVLVVGSQVVESGGSGILVAGPEPTLELRDVQVLANGTGVPSPGIDIRFEGDGAVMARGVLIEDNHGDGVRILLGDAVDFGTVSSPGGNSIRGNRGPQVLDSRPGRAQPDGPILTFVGTRLNGAWPEPGIYSGPNGYGNFIAGRMDWQIDNPNNRIELGF